MKMTDKEKLVALDEYADLLYRHSEFLNDKDQIHMSDRIQSIVENIKKVIEDDDDIFAQLKRKETRLVDKVKDMRIEQRAFFNKKISNGQHLADAKRLEKEVDILLRDIHDGQLELF